MRFLLIPLLLISLAAGAQSPAPTPTEQQQSKAAGASAASTEPEMTPTNSNPRQALDAWLESFNKHDAAARQRWLLDNTTYSPEQAEQIATLDQKIRNAHGPFELVRVVRTEGQTIEVEARHTGSGGGARLEVTLDEKEPKRIAEVKLQQAEVKGNGDGPG